MSTGAILGSLGYSRGGLLDLSLSSYGGLGSLSVSFGGYKDGDSVDLPGDSSIRGLGVSSIILSSFSFSHFFELGRLSYDGYGLHALGPTSVPSLRGLVYSNGLLSALGLDHLSNLGCLSYSSGDVRALGLPSAESLGALCYRGGLLAGLGLSNFLSLGGLGYSSGGLLRPSLHNYFPRRLVYGSGIVHAPVRFCSLSRFTSPRSVAVVRGNVVSASCQLATVGGLGPMGVHHEFADTSARRCNARVVCVKCLLRGSFQSPTLFRRVRRGCPLASSRVLSHRCLGRISSLSFSRSFPLFPSSLTCFAKLGDLEYASLPRVARLSLDEGPRLARLVYVKANVHSLGLASGGDLRSIRLYGGDLSSLGVAKLASLSDLSYHFGSLIDISAANYATLGSGLFFPRRAYAIGTSRTKGVSFSRLKGFRRRLSAPTTVLTNSRLLCAPKSSFFALLDPTMAVARTSFSVVSAGA